MKTLLIAVFCLASMCPSISAKDGDNSVADSITGIYMVTHGGEDSKVRVYRQDDGTFCAQVCWLKNRLDSDGKVRLDEKNPDKSLRNVPCDKIILIEGLKYDAGKKRWSDGKIYDPTRGIRANATCVFESGTRLKIRGSIMGIGETIYWEKLPE